MKVQTKVEMTVATDSDLKDILWKYTDDALNSIVRTDLDSHSGGVANVKSADVADFSVPFGDVGLGAILFISSDTEVDVVLNGGTDTITIKPLNAYRGMIFLHGEFTSAIVKRPAAGTAIVRYCVVGAEV